MDNRNYLLSNTLVNNKYEAAIEFAYQGPLLKYYGKSTVIAVTGDVNFSITKKNKKLINGECYKNYVLENEDELDIISTNKSVYGYLSVSGGFVLEKILNSYSTFSRAKIGPFKGEKLFVNQKILINKTSNFKTQKKIKYVNTNKEFIVTKLTDRMGMRIKGPIIENIKEKNIRSEGIVKGTIQIPPDGDPIIMLSDHGTIGGYPKIGVVISADYDKLVQLVPNTKIKFKLVNLSEAEKIYEIYRLETDNLINQIK